MKLCDERLKTGIECARLPRAAVCARQTRSFVYALITVFVSSIEARQPRTAVDRFSILPRKEHRNATRPSPLTEHSTRPSTCRGTQNRSDLAQHAPISRAAVCYAKQRTLPRAAAARSRYPAFQSTERHLVKISYQRGPIDSVRDSLHSKAN
jgi:hypothetical protein